MASRMDNPRPERRSSGRKVRVPLRRNRGARPRSKDWTKVARDNEDLALDAHAAESMSAKGALSRRRTITLAGEEPSAAGLRRGTVVAVRGLYCDVDGGAQMWPCTVRRVLRTRLIRERHPVAVGDRVAFKLSAGPDGTAADGVIHEVFPRTSELRRRTGKRVHTIAANVDQAVIVSTARLPLPKAHLIDRYLVAAHAGRMTPIVCMNKIDLDDDGSAAEVLARYTGLGYRTLLVSAVRGDGIEELTAVLKDKSSVLAGQSGVGKSSLLNAIEPGLRLQVGDIIEQIEKGRHTTCTATLLKLGIGGYVVDTPGVRSFDLSIIAKFELEAFFLEFVDLVAKCRFPDCTHTHEEDCAIKRAVDEGRIHPERYDSYTKLYAEASTPGWQNRPRE